MKRNRLLALVAVPPLLALAACGGVSSEPSAGTGEASGSITMWAYPVPPLVDGSDWQPLIDDFNEVYPDVEVDVIVKPWDKREETLVTAIVGGNEPDVIYFNPGYVTNFAGQDLLLPLDDLRDDWDMFTPAALDAMSYNGELYASPTLVAVMTSYCNTTVLEAAGVEECPTTWDEMREVAPAIKDAGYYLTEYYGTKTLNHNFFPYLWQAGGEILNEDQTEATFNGPEGVKALSFLKEMVDNGWIPTEPISTDVPLEQSAVGRQEAAYQMAADLSQVRNVVPTEVIETVQPLADVEQVAAGSVGGWAIFNRTKSVDAAKALVHHFGETPFMEEFLPLTGYLSPRTDVTGLFPDDPQFAQGADHLDVLRTDLSHAQAAKFMNMIRPHIQRVLLEGLDVQEGLDAAAEEVNRALAEDN